MQFSADAVQVSPYRRCMVAVSGFFRDWLDFPLYRSPRFSPTSRFLRPINKLIMLRLPTILTALIALGGIAATTKTFRTDDGKQPSSETVDSSQPSEKNAEESGTNADPSHFGDQLDGGRQSEQSSASTGNQYFSQYFYSTARWFRRHFWYEEKTREIERKDRALTVNSQENSSRRENFFRSADPSHREDPFRRADSFHHEDPFQRSSSFRHEDPFQRGAQFPHEDSFRSWQQSQQASSHSPFSQPQEQSGYRSPLSQPSRSTTSTSSSTGSTQVHRNPPPVNRGPPQQPGLNH